MVVNYCNSQPHVFQHTSPLRSLPATFRKLNDGYPRVLITKDRADYSVEGARHLNFYDFLFGCGL